MTPMCAIQVEDLRREFDGDVRVLGDHGHVVSVLCTPRGCAPIRSGEELIDYLQQHPDAAEVMAYLDWICELRKPFVLVLNTATFKTLGCSLPALRAVR